jgi:eukaryotic-like serine/threonine-protein kinase
VLGEIISDRYEIVRQLGEGGMGAVYEAVCIDTRDHVALKVISTGDLVKDKALIGRFHREAKVAGSIETEHIVRVLDTGTDATSGRPFMVMEYLEGEDLGQLFRRVGTISADLALRITAQACLGLQKAYEAHVVHRDIKPANIFLARRGGPGGAIVAKILDFGIAKIKMDQAQITDTTGLTRTGSMLGSPLFMSPEQARGSKHIDHRADIWSLGVVLYQALTGRTPNHEIEALGELIIAICSELPRPVQDFAPWVSPEVAAIVHKALQLDPAERFQTGGAMLEAIKPLLPQGWDIREPMLVGVSTEERATLAPRLQLTTTGGRLRPLASAVTSDSGQVLGRTDIASTLALSEMQHSLRPRPAPSRLPLVLAGVVVLGGLAGGAAYKLTGEAASRLDPPAPAVQPEGAAKTAAPASTSGRDPASPTSGAAPAATAAEPAMRTVKLVILPSIASVEVDGAAAKPADGVLEITGALGSTHKVRVFRGATETVMDVKVTESGAAPPIIKLEAAAPGAPRTPGAKTATPPVTPSTRPSVPPTTPGTTTSPFKEKFE